MFNITVDTIEPIQDCAPWNSEGVSGQVTFTCFQLIYTMYSVEAFFAILGGLSTFFYDNLKITTGVLLYGSMGTAAIAKNAKNLRLLQEMH